MADATMAKGRDQAVDASLNLLLVVGGDPEPHPLLLVPVPPPKVKGKERCIPWQGITPVIP